MSLIYDALRKSEQQRRAGETPTLATDPGWGARRAQSPRRLSPWLRLALPAVVLASAAGAWFVYSRQGAEQAVTAPVAGEGAAVPPTGADAPPAAAASSPEPLVAAPVPAEPAPVQPPPPPQPPAEIAPPAADASSAAAIQALTGAPAMAEPAPAVVPPPPPTDAEPTAPAASLLASDPATTAPPPPVDAAVATPPPAPGPAAAPATQPVATAPPEPTLPLVYELPYAVRKNMPKLALSMHVYNTDPARRFAIINDERRGEGAEFDDVRVVAIRRDGIELEYAGQRFLLPRVGG